MLGGHRADTVVPAIAADVIPIPTCFEQCHRQCSAAGDVDVISAADIHIGDLGVRPASVGNRRARRPGKFVPML